MGPVGGRAGARWRSVRASECRLLFAPRGRRSSAVWPLTTAWAPCPTCCSSPACLLSSTRSAAPWDTPAPEVTDSHPRGTDWRYEVLIQGQCILPPWRSSQAYHTRLKECIFYNIPYIFITLPCLLESSIKAGIVIYALIRHL